MTSKEALKELQEYTLVTYDDDGNEIDCYKLEELEPNLFEPIKKDLEVLSILRKYLSFEDITYSDSTVLNLYGDFIDKSEEIKKVKEWFKNE